MFVLHIHTVNEAMQSRYAIAEQLIHVANLLRPYRAPEEGKLHDDNGNEVGAWADYSQPRPGLPAHSCP